MKDPEPEERRGARRWTRVVLLPLAGIAAGAFLAEAGHRAWRTASGSPYSAERTREELALAKERASSFAPRDRPGASPAPDLERRALHPFLGWDYADGNARIETALAGSRERKGDGSDLDVLVVGGSVAELFDQRGGTARLGELLAADPRLAGRRVRFVPFGRSGFKQPQQLNLVTWLFALGFEADVVLAIDGFNEVALGANNAAEGQSAAYPSFMHWSHLALGWSTDRAMLDEIAAVRGEQRAIEASLERVLRLGLERSSLLGTLALARVRGHQRACEAAFERYTAALVASAASPAVRGPSVSADAEASLGLAVRCWLESSRMLSAVCRERGIHYLHVLQPTLHDEGSKPRTAEEIENGGIPDAWLDGVRRGYPMLRAAGARLAASGVDFVDLSASFADRSDTIYFDNCHFGGLGNRLLAERISTPLGELCARPAPTR